MSVRLVRGNDAVVIGALYAGCECFFGYPITPASEISHAAATWFPKAGRVFLQAECETAAINMVYGAAAAGQKAMTASSGPGISLMQEGFSYIAAAELPCVVADIVRAGPGLGNIGPEQSDYNQIVKGGGHGCYRNIVLAPASVQEMCDFMGRAFDLAFAYRTPVVLLADAVIGQMIEPLQMPTQEAPPQDSREWAVSATAETRQNVVTSIFLDFDHLERLNLRLQEKYAAIEEKEALVDLYQAEDAEILVVAYGASSRLARSAVDQARAAGLAVGLFRPMTLFPFPKAELNRLVKGGAKRLLCVEMSNGQLRDDLRLFTECRVPVELVCRYGGNLITVEDIIARLTLAAQALQP